MKEIKQVLEQLLRQKQMWHILQENILINDWEKIVGDKIGAVSRAKYISKGVLKVRVNNSTWAYHLNLLKPQLIKKLNDHAKKKTVKDIIFLVGDLEKQENCMENQNN